MIKNKTICYFACNEAKTMLTLQRLENGEYHIMFEINGVHQDAMTIKTNDLNDALEEFEKLIKAIFDDNAEKFMK